jgi:hypothetical protein
MRTQPFFIFILWRMKKYFFYGMILGAVSLLAGCTGKPKPADNAAGKEPVVQSALRVQQALDSVKLLAQTGDLLLRSGDDMLSYQIKTLNETERLYSHSGLIIEQGGQKWVAHITPDSTHLDSIQLISIDSFVNPQLNNACALYRYRLSGPEKSRIPYLIDSLRAAHVRFDRYYQLSTNDKMYCSEMIAKTIATVSGNRVSFRKTHPPAKMVKLVAKFFQKQGIPFTEKSVAERDIITLDNLYLHTDCDLIIKAKLKYYPGE